MLPLIGIGALSVFLYITASYLVSVYQKNISIIDIAWGFGFSLLAIVLFIHNKSHPLIQNIVTLLVIIWGVRLGIHIGLRKIGKPEDWRYTRFRSKFGPRATLLSYPRIYILQGILMLIIAAPLFVSANNSWSMASSTLLGTLGLGVWLAGFWLEVIADYQLSQFVKSSKKGEFMKTGLWRYSRHPNYFGEIIIWWGLWLMIVSLPYGWWAIVSPLLITYLILFVSGVPVLENKYSRRAGFAQYAKRTSLIVPLPARKD